MTRALDTEVKQGLAPIDLLVVDVMKYIPASCYISYSKQYPTAGLGLFAKEMIPKGAFLGNYMGRICDKNHKGPYVFHVSVPGSTEFSIDGENVHESNFTRFINCSLSEDHENVMVITCGNKGFMHGKLCFYAKRDISINEEIAFDYGEEYVKALKKNIEEQK